MNTLASLLVGERIVSRCEDGLLEAEFALFDRSEVLLSAGPGKGVHEIGYLTTAGFARSRLAEAGLSEDLAQAALGALGPGYMRALANSPAVLRVIDRLGPMEAFEGGTFVASSGRYLGTWLDLEALAEVTSREVCLWVQALHLFLAVGEVEENAPVRLLTARAIELGLPGERSWRPVPLHRAQQLPSTFRSMAPPRSVRSPADEADVRESLLRSLRARASASEKSRARLLALASDLAATGKASPVEAGSGGRASAAPRDSSAPPEARLPAAFAENPLRLFEEFRRHSQGLRGEYHIRAVARFLTSMANRPSALPDLTILAARAWLAAGEPGHARHFAKKIVESPDAGDEARLAALEILDSTSPTSESNRPPAGAPIQPVPTIVLSTEPDRRAPIGASMPPYVRETHAQEAHEAGRRVAIPPAAAVPPLPGGPMKAAPVLVEPRPAVRAAAPSPPPLPSPPSLHPALPPPPPVAQTGRAEIVETMSLPPGAEEGMLAPGARPSDPLQTRIAMTRLAREIGRDYRLWYGTTLKTDLVAIDAMQRHLRRRFLDTSTDEAHERQLEEELTRHGALLSEILARSFGAEWVDVSSLHPGQWAMLLPKEVRVWPIGRVYRFFRQGHRESDLVAFYLDLETQSKRK